MACRSPSKQPRIAEAALELRAQRERAPSKGGDVRYCAVRGAFTKRHRSLESQREIRSARCSSDCRSVASAPAPINVTGLPLRERKPSIACVTPTPDCNSEIWRRRTRPRRTRFPSTARTARGAILRVRNVHRNIFWLDSLKSDRKRCWTGGVRTSPKRNRSRPRLVAEKERYGHRQSVRRLYEQHVRPAAAGRGGRHFGAAGTFRRTRRRPARRFDRTGRNRLFGGRVERLPLRSAFRSAVYGKRRS
jgi:hypothetical protein